MSTDIAELLSDVDLTLNPGASCEVIHAVELQLGVAFPQQYVDFLAQSNGAEGSVGGDAYLVLWPVEEIIPLNQAYAVDEFAPGLLLIGSDGGDTAYAFDTRIEQMTIVEIPFVGMALEKSHWRAETFTELLKWLRDSAK